MGGEEIYLSLEEIVSKIKMPWFMKGVSEGEIIIKFNEKKKFELVKKGYEESLKKIISSKEKNIPFMFREFLDRYHIYFGEDYRILGSLDDKIIECVVGSLKFKENLKKHRYSIPGYLPDYLH